MATGKNGPAKFVALGGLLVVLSDTNVEQTGLQVGARYRITAVGGGALLRWGTTDAAASDGGFDFAVGANESVDVVATNSAINIIEANADSTANAVVLIQRYADDF